MPGFRMEIQGLNRVVSKFKGLSEGVLGRRLYSRMSGLAQAIREYVVHAKLQGQVLHHRSGVLSNAVAWKANIEPERVWSKVFVGRQAWYGRIHEYGGDFDVPAHPRLVRQLFGKPVKPHWVLIQDYVVHFPVRSFMRSSLKEWRSRAVGQVKLAVREALAS